MFSQVTGSLLVDLDGRILASNLEKDAEDKNLAACALETYENNFRVAKDLGQQRVHQMCVPHRKGLYLYHRQRTLS